MNRTYRRPSFWIFKSAEKTALCGSVAMLSTFHQAFGDAVLAFLSDAGESLFETRHCYKKLPMVEAEQLEHGGVQIMQMDFVFHSPEADFVGCPDSFAALDSSSGHQN